MVNSRRDISPDEKLGKLCGPASGNAPSPNAPATSLSARSNGSKNLANLIRDVRRDLDAPELPFVIGELGQQGVDPQKRYAAKHFRFRKIQKGVANREEFKDTVRFVKTSPYVVKDGKRFDGGYHYMGRADTFFHIGQAFGKAMLKLLDEDCQP